MGTKDNGRFTPEERRLTSAQLSRKETVLRVVRSAILDGRFPAGTRLDQNRIAAELGVSRMPVREAIKQLEANGLVVVLPYRGVEVARLDPAAVTELFGIRIALETLAIGRAVERLETKQLERMRRTLEKMDRHIRAGSSDDDAWMRLNGAFHNTINEASGWSTLVESIDVFRGNVDRYVRMYLSLRGREQPQEEHWAIYEACVNRDVAESQRIIAVHLENTAAALVFALGDSVEREANRSQTNRLNLATQA